MLSLSLKAHEQYRKNTYVLLKAAVHLFWKALTTHAPTTNTYLPQHSNNPVHDRYYKQTDGPDGKFVHEINWVAYERGAD